MRHDIRFGHGLRAGALALATAAAAGPALAGDFDPDTALPAWPDADAASAAAVPAGAGPLGTDAPAAATPSAGPAQAPAASGPFASLGKRLNDNGFYPILFLGEWYVSNPNSGVRPGSHQFQTQVNAGFDFDLEPLFGLKGTSVHFIESYVPWITSQTATDNYFTQMGDVINASASGYVPVTAHLTRFSVKQEFGGGKAFVEAGKGYVNDYVARPDCLTAFMCMSVIAITHKASGFNFPNYSNWFGRVGFKPTANLTVQGIWYQDDNDASLTNGWERWRDSNYPGYLVDVQYAAPRADKPSAWEVMYYHDKVPQTRQLCATCLKTVTNWQAGVFASGMTTFWRPDPHRSKMLQGFVSFANAMNDKQTTAPSVGGLQYAADIGLIMRGPFASRPFDSYSLQLTTVRLSRDEQVWLENQGYGKPGRSEYSIGASAFFKVSDSVFVSPYVEYLVNANAAFASNAYTNPQHRQPSDGFAVGVALIVQLGKMLGLSPRGSGYDGHYP